MRILAIGDIHGCLRAFDTLLEMVDPQPDDLLITLGDYVDRGPDSKGVLDRLLELQDRCRLVTLTGNHEFMMLDAREGRDGFKSWCACGGREALDSYGPFLDWETFAARVPDRHWRFVRECKPFHETAGHFFVHANAHPSVELTAQTHEALFWEQIDPAWSRPHISGKVMVCGHTQQRSGRPLDLGHAVCIDTGAHAGGWLTCLDVESAVYWQANQRGQTRLGNLGSRSR
jgi:serine/threonine protein phosphatase 1